ncbi:MAG: DNA polymerase III subunit alpha [Nitrospirae bacterium]|nr:MAG: DNA polymerase III subunit alpha [Nitrospirota bacterium]
MQYADFVPLHLHSEYSLLDGAIKINELVDMAVQYRMPAVAVTDHGNMFGAVEFYKKATKAGIKPIIGCEVYVAPKSRFDKAKESLEAGLSEEAAFHLVLLARNQQGYKNLTTLASKAYIEGFYYKPRIDKELLEQYSGGLIGLSACLKGEVPYLLQRGMYEKARETALQYKHILGPENFYLEIQHNGLPEQEEANKKLVELADALHIPLVATNDCHYLRKEDAKAHNILLCIQTGKTVKDEKRMKFTTEEFYFKSPDEMKQAFQDLPEAIKNTRLIAERCNVDFKLGQSLLPKYTPEDESRPEDFLEGHAKQGLKNMFGQNPPEHYKKRLMHELHVIKTMGFASYFLIVWDFIDHAKKLGIPVGPGRGSAAGSLVAYCLGITEIDPIKYGLLFERFLNPERISMPDIDVDFCQDRRTEVIAYVAEKYGKDKVSQIITFGTMKAKAAIRDVGRALAVPYSEVDKIAKLVPDELKITIKDALEKEPQLKEIYENNPEIKELIDIAQRLEGLSRHASTHAAGVVIAPELLTEYTALYKQQGEDIPATQFDMGSIESIGLLKFDFLGLKTLTIIHKTVEFLLKKDSDFKLASIPLDDKDTYRLLSSGETTGVFQLESSGMRDILVRMQPDRFEDLIALVALYRPGPMAYIDDFIKRKKGGVAVEYAIPELKEILDETYGIILYQEQVMLIANKIANFSLGQADLLRRAMGKKKKEEMEQQKEFFVKGAVENNFPEAKAKRLFEDVEPFAGYGFNKSHAAAYALLAYQTAYLKAHYPVEFMTAYLTADMGDTDKLVKLINECRNMSIDILPPDINLSGREFTIVGSSIRFGLEAVKGVGAAAIEIILQERATGPFKGFEDFTERVDNKKVNKKVIESLIKAGAFDSLFQDPPLFARPKAFSLFSSAGKNRSLGPGLFGDAQEEDQTKPWDDTELLKFEKESLGFYISGHPLARYRRTLSSMGVVQIEQIEDISEGIEISAAGIVAAIKTIIKEKGTTVIVTLEDETGTIDVLSFSKNGKKADGFLKKGALVMTRATVLKEEKGAKLKSWEFTDISGMQITTKYEVSLDCNDEEEALSNIKKIRGFLAESADGNDNTLLSFRFYLPEYCVIIASQLKPGGNFMAGMKKITGGSVKVL